MKGADPMQLDDETLTTIAACATLIRRSILTLAALPDRERKWLHHADASKMPEVVRDFFDAYSPDASPRVRRFHPTARDIDRMDDGLAMVCWLGQQPNGSRDVKLVWARAFDAPWWKLAQRFGRSESTIRRWHDGAITRVYGAFESKL